MQSLTARQCLCRYLPGVTLATLAEAHYHHAYPIDLSERRVQHIALHLLQVGAGAPRLTLTRQRTDDSASGRCSYMLLPSEQAW